MKTMKHTAESIMELIKSLMTKLHRAFNDLRFTEQAIEKYLAKLRFADVWTGKICRGSPGLRNGK